MEYSIKVIHVYLPPEKIYELAWRPWIRNFQPIARTKGPIPANKSRNSREEKKKRRQTCLSKQRFFPYKTCTLPYAPFRAIHRRWLRKSSSKGGSAKVIVSLTTLRRLAVRMQRGKNFLNGPSSANATRSPTRDIHLSWQSLFAFPCHFLSFSLSLFVSSSRGWLLDSWHLAFIIGRLIYAKTLPD